MTSVGHMIPCSVDTAGILLRPKTKNAGMMAALACSNILIDECFTDRLFKMSPDIESVRNLKKQLYQGHYAAVERQPDAHVIASTLLQILKEMETSLFHDVYEDLLSIEITEDLVYSKLLVVNQLNKLDVTHCELVKTFIHSVHLSFCPL